MAPVIPAVRVQRVVDGDVVVDLSKKTFTQLQPAIQQEVVIDLVIA